MSKTLRYVYCNAGKRKQRVYIDITKDSSLGMCAERNAL
jgi:hypothetical protein